MPFDRQGKDAGWATAVPPQLQAQLLANRAGGAILPNAMMPETQTVTCGSALAWVNTMTDDSRHAIIKYSQQVDRRFQLMAQPLQVNQAWGTNVRMGSVPPPTPPGQYHMLKPTVDVIQSPTCWSCQPKLTDTQWDELIYWKQRTQLLEAGHMLPDPSLPVVMVSPRPAPLSPAVHASSADVQVPGVSSLAALPPLVRATRPQAPGAVPGAADMDEASAAALANQQEQQHLQRQREQQQQRDQPQHLQRELPAGSVLPATAQATPTAAAAATGPVAAAAAPAAQLPDQHEQQLQQRELQLQQREQQLLQREQQLQQQQQYQQQQQQQGPGLHDLVQDPQAATTRAFPPPSTQLPGQLVQGPSPREEEVLTLSQPTQLTPTTWQQHLVGDEMQRQLPPPTGPPLGPPLGGQPPLGPPLGGPPPLGPPLGPPQVMDEMQRNLPPPPPGVPVPLGSGGAGGPSSPGALVGNMQELPSVQAGQQQQQQQPPPPTEVKKSSGMCGWLSCCGSTAPTEPGPPPYLPVPPGYVPPGTQPAPGAPLPPSLPQQQGVSGQPQGPPGSPMALPLPGPPQQGPSGTRGVSEFGVGAGSPPQPDGTTAGYAPAAGAAGGAHPPQAPVSQDVMRAAAQPNTSAGITTVPDTPSSAQQAPVTPAANTAQAYSQPTTPATTTAAASGAAATPAFPNPAPGFQQATTIPTASPTTATFAATPPSPPAATPPTSGLQPVSITAPPPAAPAYQDVPLPAPRVLTPLGGASPSTSPLAPLGTSPTSMTPLAPLGASPGTTPLAPLGATPGASPLTPLGAAPGTTPLASLAGSTPNATITQLESLAPPTRLGGLQPLQPLLAPPAPAAAPAGPGVASTTGSGTGMTNTNVTIGSAIATGTGTAALQQPAAPARNSAW